MARSDARCSTGWWWGRPRRRRWSRATRRTPRALGQRRETDGRAHVVAENEERAAEREHAAVERHAVHRRAHRVLAHAEMDAAPADSSRLDDRGGAFDCASGVAGEVGGAAGTQRRDDVEDRVEHLLARRARRDRLHRLSNGAACASQPGSPGRAGTRRTPRHSRRARSRQASRTRSLPLARWTATAHARRRGRWRRRRRARRSPSAGSPSRLGGGDVVGAEQAAVRVRGVGVLGRRPYPMWVRSTTSDGRSVLGMPSRRRGLEDVEVVRASPTSWTCQP